MGVGVGVPSKTGNGREEERKEVNEENETKEE